MKVYLVGGAVRDELLGRPVSDRDWVVVDSTVSDMLAAGFQQVGRDFPVFLHPETHQEYALARIERKVGAGHQGFVCHTGPDVSLEDDLKRRDLTINAMARDAGGNLIDPYGGEEDLKNYRLQHVSDAFSEDPLRVFRVARFAAELHGFKASPETLNLMRDMASAGTLDELPAERVWAETIKALSGPDPQHYFAVLHGVGALLPWFVELDGLAWNESADLIPDELLDPLLRFGVLGWWLTAGQAQALVDRLKPPNDYSDLLVQCATNARLLVRWREQPDVDVYRAMTQCGAFRSHPRWQQLFQILDSISRTDLSSLEQVVNTMRQIHGRDFAADGISGGEIGRRLMQARLAVLRKELES